MQKYWTIAFYLACVACPALLLLAQHNYGLMQYYAGTVGILATVGIGAPGLPREQLPLWLIHQIVSGGAAGILPVKSAFHPRGSQSRRCRRNSASPEKSTSWNLYSGDAGARPERNR